MQTVTPAFAALKDASHTVIFLVEMGNINRAFATATARGGAPEAPPWLLGSGALLGSGVRLGQPRAWEPDLARLDAGGLGAVTHALAPDGTARISNMTLTLRNEEDLAATFDTVVLDNTALRILVGFPGLGLSDYLPLFTGVVDSYTSDWETLTLDCIDGAFRTHGDLSVVLETAYAVGVPFPLGHSTDVEAVPIEGDASGKLAFDLPLSGTLLELLGVQGTFPATGTITLGIEEAVPLGTEVGITYSGAQEVILDETPYLRLEGLVRTEIVDHLVGTSVTLIPTWRYLIGYQIYELLRVRIAGEEQVDGWTLTQEVAHNGIPVSILTFEAKPVGKVTVDIRSGNLKPLPTFANGSFEIGGGWVDEDSALTMTTGDTAHGDKKGEVLGDWNAERQISMQFATLVGEQYTLRFAYRDTQEGVNLIPNGDFNDATLAPLVPSSPEAARRVSRSTTFNPVEEGAGALALNHHIPYPYGAFYNVSAYWDIPTDIGTVYIFQFMYSTKFWFASGGAYAYDYSRARYAIGPDSAPTLYADVTLPMENCGYSHNGEWYQLRYIHSGLIYFTATTVLTRLTLGGMGSIVTFTPSLPASTYFDAVRLFDTSSYSESRSHFRLGSPATPGRYADTILEKRLGWVRRRVAWIAEEPATQLTLLSQYSAEVLPTPSYYDDVVPLDSGLNPILAIRFMIETFLPHLPMHRAAFDRASLARAGWYFSTVLRAPGDSRTLLARMAMQCFCRYFEDAQGRATVVARHRTGGGAVFALSQANIVEDSIQFTREPLDTLGTDFYLWFGYKGAGAWNTRTSYRSTLYVTIEETNAAPELQQQCLACLQRYGRRQRIDIYADMISDTLTAALLLERIVATRTVRHAEIALRTTFAAVHLELGDVVLLTHPRLAQGRALYCEVQEVQPQPASALVQLQLQEIAFAGWVEDFETFATGIVGAGGWTEDWE